MSLELVYELVHVNYRDDPESFTFVYIRIGKSICMGIVHVPFLYDML